MRAEISAAGLLLASKASEDASGTWHRDLGDPDKSPDLARLPLGGPAQPYPRRLKTNRPPVSDGVTESRPRAPPRPPRMPLLWFPLLSLPAFPHMHVSDACPTEPAMRWRG